MAGRRPQETERTGGAYKPGATLAIPEGASYRNRHGTATPASGTWTGAAPTAAGAPGRGSPSRPPGMPTGNPNATPGGSPYSFDGGLGGPRGGMNTPGLGGGYGMNNYGKPLTFGGNPNTLGARGAAAGAGYVAPTPEAPPPEGGSQSGPGILESWFNQRAAGIDAASQYATKRGLDALNDRYAAAGMANSGAARQGDADLLANIEAQRAGQLDALAGGASGEHQRRLDSMFGQGLGLAGGQSQINSAYDLRAAQAQSDALSAALNYFLNKAGVDDKSRQSGFNNILGLGSLFA